MNKTRTTTLWITAILITVALLSCGDKDIGAPLGNSSELGVPSIKTLTATKTTNGLSLTLSWDQVTGSPTSYEILYHTNNQISFATLFTGTVNNSETIIPVTTALDSTIYVWVKAIKENLTNVSTYMSVNVWDYREVDSHIYYPSYAFYRHKDGDFVSDDTIDGRGTNLGITPYANRYSMKNFLNRDLSGNSRLRPVISFGVIGDGAEKLQSESMPNLVMPLNRAFMDDLWAWTTGWFSRNTAQGNRLEYHYTGDSDYYEANLVRGVTTSSLNNFGLALGGWPKGGLATDPLRNAGFERLADDPIALSNYIGSLTTGYSPEPISGTKNIVFPEANGGHYWKALTGGLYNKVDTIHLDWEFPETTQQAAQLNTLCEGFKTAKTGKSLSLAISANLDKIKNLNFTTLNNCANRFKLMSYDFNGVWSEDSGHHTPLYDSAAPYSNEYTNTYVGGAHDAAELLLARGVPASKIYIGVALYGRLWKITEAIPAAANMKAYLRVTVPTSDNFQRSPLQSAVKTDLETGGIVLYYDIERVYTPANGWERYWDDVAKAPYLIHRTKKSLVTYDDEQSIQEKINYTKKRGMGGILIWDALGARGSTILTKINGWLGSK